jgi:hypothetical protein
VARTAANDRKQGTGQNRFTVFKDLNGYDKPNDSVERELPQPEKTIEPEIERRKK